MARLELLALLLFLSGCPAPPEPPEPEPSPEASAPAWPATPAPTPPATAPTPGDPSAWPGPTLGCDWDHCVLDLPDPPPGCWLVDRTSYSCEDLDTGCVLRGTFELHCGDPEPRAVPVDLHAPCFCEVVGDMDGDGLDPALGDCDDTDPSFHPRAKEACDMIDHDCDGDLVDGFPDSDGDGLPDCVDPDADGDGVARPEDCDDADPERWPGSPAACDRGGCGRLADLDGDGLDDCADSDDDGDGHPDDQDCGPRDPSIHPGAAEACDDLDSDCDGDVVDDFDDLDRDGDPDCTDPDDDGDGVEDADDCVPRNRYAYRGAPEFCDQLDSDCDGDIIDHYFDADPDGDGVLVCEPGALGSPPPGWPPEGLPWPPKPAPAPGVRPPRP